MGLTLLLVLLIVFLRFKLRRDLRRERDFVDLWRPLLLDAVSQAHSDDPPRALPELRTRDHVLFLKLWVYLQESLRGSANNRLNELARRLGCEASVHHFLRHGKRAERLLAILALGHLRDPSAWDELSQQARWRDSLVSIHAARAIIRIDPLQATELLLPLLLARTDWGIAQVAGFLAEVRPAFGLRLTQNLLKVKRECWLRALQLTDALRLELPVQSMRFILEQSPSVETLVAALHLASSLHLLPAVRPYMDHPDWRVRVEAARFLSRFGDEQDIASLERLLKDAQWWVRYQAAQALVQMPFYGRQALQALCTTTVDALARDMLRHVLAEHETVPV